MMPIRFSQVVPGVYRGGEPSAEQLRTLRDKYGVKRILSLDPDIGQAIDPEVRRLKMEHIIVPLGDESTMTDSLKYLQRNINSLFSNRPMFVHCRQGKDRTGLAVALFRIANGMGPEQALQEARSHGFGIGMTNQRLQIYTQMILNANGAVDLKTPTTPTTPSTPEDTNAADTDIVSLERGMMGDTGRQIDPFDSRTSFGPMYPMPQTQLERPDPLSTENLSSNVDHARADDKEKRKKRRRKWRKMILDVNDAMAQTGVFENTNPILRGLGPIEPGGILPYGWSFAM